MTIHNAIFTVVLKETREHHTFKISTAQHGPLEGKRIVSVLAGPDNTADYLGIGFLNENGIAVWKKNVGGKLEAHARLLEQLLGLKLCTSQFKEQYEVKESRCCRRCNRTLTTPESIELGVGPECATKC